MASGTGRPGMTLPCYEAARSLFPQSFQKRVRFSQYDGYITTNREREGTDRTHRKPLRPGYGGDTEAGALIATNPRLVSLNVA
jgi:hypothetical protein